MTSSGCTLSNPSMFAHVAKVYDRLCPKLVAIAPSPDLTTPSPGIFASHSGILGFTPLPVYGFPKKLAPNVSNNPFCYFAPFSNI